MTPATDNAMDLPRWDLTPFFTSLEGPDYVLAVQRMEDDLITLETAVGDAASNETDTDDAATLETILTQLNDLHDQTRIVRGFVHGHFTTDSRDELAQGRMSELQSCITRLQTVQTRLIQWIGSLSVEEMIEQSSVLKDHAFCLRKFKKQAEKLMSPAEEELAAILAETGEVAWSKLYGNVTSQIEVDVNNRHEPMSAVRAMAFDDDPKTRRTAYDAEIAAWNENEVVIAAALNSIKGETAALGRRRGWDTLLDQALFVANMDREILDAMQSAVRDAFPRFRRYLRAKSQCLGHADGLPWWDLFAPVGEGRSWSYEEAEQFVEQCFRTYSGTLGDFAARSFTERWIDAAPRSGKRDGAFCMGLRGEESRILMNFKPAFGSVTTLAHELGHAYHNRCLASRTPLQRETPMTLAETASIFCEMIVKRAAMREAHEAEELAMLDASLQGVNQIVVDIDSRFRFESEVLDRRAERELSARECCEIMTKAQRATYGDGLDADTLHPYMWAAKPHYYGGRPFYNFPYTFGLLFGLGLYAIYECEPKGFQDRYDNLLSSTGMDKATVLADRFGIDLRDTTFWEQSLDVIGRDIERFEALAMDTDRIMDWI